MAMGQMVNSLLDEFGKFDLFSTSNSCSSSISGMFHQAHFVFQVRRNRSKLPECFKW